MGRFRPLINQLHQFAVNLVNLLTPVCYVHARSYLRSSVAID
jgi:hypothetical protein